jgi:RNA polymerase sigma factor (sigma-70 family)
MSIPIDVVPSAIPVPASQHPVSLADVVISEELLSRPIHILDSRIEIKAMHDLARLLSEGAPRVLKRLAQMAIELCDAGSGGISVLEVDDHGNHQFRWQALAGELERYEGGTTPRDWSPCGQALKAAKAMLYSYPARFFTYFQEVSTPLVEGLVIPMFAGGQPIGAMWVVTHDETRNFDAEDVRIMTSLAGFVAAALRISPARSTGSAESAKAGRDAVWTELISRITDGNTSALTHLMDETRPVVFARALRILRLRADAEETTMDVYSHIWKRARSFDPERGNPLAWMLNIARNCAIDRLRSRSRQKSIESLDFECSSATDFKEYAASPGAKMDVNRALQALPVEQRRAIELAYFSGYSMTQVATLLGHPLGTVKSRIRAGLIGLRSLLATKETHKSPPLDFSMVVEDPITK